MRSLNFHSVVAAIVAVNYPLVVTFHVLKFLEVLRQRVQLLWGLSIDVLDY